MKYSYLAAATSVAMLFGSFCNAQDDEPFSDSAQSIDIIAVQTDEQEGEDPFGGDVVPMVIEHVEDTENGQTRMRVVSGSEGAMGGAMIFQGTSGGSFSMLPGMSGSDSFGMLHNPSVQKDLELVDDQMARIREIQKSFGKKVKESMGELKGGNYENFSQVMKDLKAQQEDDINSVLLDHQKNRLKQVSLQMQMQNRGTAGTLASGKIADELGITDDQKKRIKEKSKELQKMMEEKIAQLKEKSKRELLNELTPEQQKKLTELTGDKFKMESSDFSQSFRSFGGKQIQRKR